MGKESGTMREESRQAFLFLAFFTVVASSPNLSTLVLSGAKVQKK